MSIPKINYLLQLGDNALILGHRLSEWCGHGPVLEQDIALTNIALDHLGQTRSLYQYAAELINDLHIEKRKELFPSPPLHNKENDFKEDDLAYLRDVWDFKNILLVEQPNQDWAYTIARSFYYDHYNALLYSALKNQNNDSRLKAIAEKSLKETKYHKRWSSEWIIRLGDGTQESHQKIQKAILELWSFTNEFFHTSSDESLIQNQFSDFNTEQIKNKWHTEIFAILEQATLQLPDLNTWMQAGGKKGIHSEHLGFLLAELQYVQRAYPGMEW